MWLFLSWALKGFFDPWDVTMATKVQLWYLRCALSTYQTVNKMSCMNLEFKGQRFGSMNLVSFSRLPRLKRSESSAPVNPALGLDTTCGASLKYLLDLSQMKPVFNKGSVLSAHNQRELFLTITAYPGIFLLLCICLRFSSRLDFSLLFVSLWVRKSRAQANSMTLALCGSVYKGVNCFDTYFTNYFFVIESNE